MSATRTDRILFSGPWVTMKGEVSSRIVLHAEFDDVQPVKFIVHVQTKDERGQLHYNDGDYYETAFPEAREKAFNQFVKRSKDHYHEGRTYCFPKDVV